MRFIRTKAFSGWGVNLIVSRLAATLLMLAWRFADSRRHEVFDPAIEMAVDDRLECFGDVGGRVDVVELAGLCRPPN